MPYAGDAAPGTGDYTLRLEDASGALLAERRFTPMVRFGDGDEDITAIGDFAETMAIPAGKTVGKVVVSKDGAAIGSRSAAAGPAPTAGDVTISTRASSATRSR